MNGISTSDKRCTNIDIITNTICKRKLIIEDGKEFCFYCSMIAAEDKLVKDEFERLMANKEVNQLMDAFREKSLMNRDLEIATLTTYKPETETQSFALKKAREYIASFDKQKGLVLQGRPGVGKSHLAASIVKELIHKKNTGIFISLPRLMTEVKATYGKKSDLQEVEILTALQKVNILVLDDLGVEIDGKSDSSSAWARGKVYEVIDSRVGMATIYTTNFTGKELLDMYGERDFSRMVQYCESVVIEGPNYRMEKFKKNGR
ncbi:ATP-binding protein [Bacillus sp. 1P06AnD]|uniref:ATP-binding protein n=1 Tax=Bacillus sp. 1P06AnD TaxID=3132208 RepID=UPI0039A3F51A